MPTPPDNGEPIVPPPQTPSEALERAKQVARGGVWADDNDISFEWRGEDTTSLQPLAAPTLVTQTASETAQSLLRSIGIDEDSERAIARIVQRQLLRELGFPSGSFKDAMKSLLAENDKRVKAWLETAMTDRVESVKQTRADEINELSTRLKIVQAQLDELQAFLKQDTEARTTLIEEASTILKTHRRAAGDDESEGSQIARFKEATAELEAKAEILSRTRAIVPAGPPTRRLKKTFY